VIRPDQVEATLALLLTWAVYVADDPACIVIEAWPEPSVPLSVTVLNQPPTPVAGSV